MKKAYLCLGSNIDDRLGNLNAAISLINDRTGEVVDRSSVYESPPWGFEAELYFYNMVVKLKTDLEPLSLLDEMEEIEKLLGRKNKSQNGKYQSRTIDIDMLFYEQKVINNKRLIVPHLNMENRLFELIPMQELAPDLIHPVFNKSVSELITECGDNSRLSKIN